MQNIWDPGEKRERIKSWEFGELTVLQIPVLQDNYSYLVGDKEGRAVAVDPADDPKILRELHSHDWDLTAIWNTHWHHDHTGGNRALLRRGVEVLGFSKARIPEITREIRQGDLLWPNFRVYEVPAHTLDHLAFVCNDSFVFSGDALFSLGCGRLFEGTPEDLLAVAETFLRLPDNMLIFCAHEYTRANLRFALSLEPQNPDLQNLAQMLSGHEVTIPSDLGFERRANPFLRLHQREFRAAMAQKVPQWQSWSAVEQMAYIRRLKDQF